MTEDRYYPGYHFRPPKNWMNDPNGLIFKDGWYHLFFQYNPNSDIWGDIHWGHARSEDLIHWEMCPIAITPSTDQGEVHCYSGCAVDKGDETKIFYTSIGVGERGPETGAQQWSAICKESNLLNWQKCGTPALSQKLNGNHLITMWRDPFVWKEAEMWYMLLSGTCEKKGCIALYNSNDLESWKFCSIFYQSEQYELIECPNIMRFGDKYVLLYSPMEAVHYSIGTIDHKNMQFISEKEGIFDYSIGKKGFYAPNVYLNDPLERYVVFGCLFEGDRLNSSRSRGWAGMQSVPRIVALEDEELRVEPAQECYMLRKKCMSIYKPDESMHAEGMQIEIELLYCPSADSVLQIILQSSPDGVEKTVVTLDYSKKDLFLDRSESTVYKDISTEDLHAPISFAERPVQLRIFVDHSSIEIFYDRRITMSARIFPSREDSVHNSLRISEDTKVLSGRIYHLECKTKIG